jgi:carboxyl-terminal processing protease
MNGNNELDELNSVQDKIKIYERKRKELIKGFWVIGSLLAVLFFIIGVIFAKFFDIGNFYIDYQDEGMAKFARIYEIMNSEWYFDEDTKEEIAPTKLADYFIDNAIMAMLDSDIDPHTGYVPATSISNDNVCGIGILMERYDGYVLVNAVYGGSSSDLAGLKRYDLITHVNGEDIRELTNTEIQTKVKGTCGTEVKITYSRNDVSTEKTLKRTHYARNSVFLEELNSDYMFVRIVEFSDIADDNLSKIFSDNKDNLPSNLIIDLRDNGGGDLRATVNIASMLIEGDKTITSLKNKNDVSEVEKTSQYATRYNFDHIYILINHNSASASEMLSLALLENLPDKVKIVGTKSYGKGTAQRVINFSDGSEFRYTYAKWYSPNGNNIHGVGIIPTNPYSTIYSDEYKDIVYDVYTTYKLYDASKEIKYAKMILNDLGYSLIESVYFDDDFKVALLDYQQKEGLTLTGELDLNTSNRILKTVVDAKLNEQAQQLNYIKTLIG